MNTPTPERERVEELTLLNRLSPIKTRCPGIFRATLYSFSVLAFLTFVFFSRYVTSGDTGTQRKWFNYLLEHGFHGILTIGADQSPAKGADYTHIWYFLDTIICKTGLYPHYPVQYSLKIMGALFTIGCSITTYFITKHILQNRTAELKATSPIKWASTITASLTLVLPVFLGDILRANAPNSSYIFFAMLAFLLWLKGKNGWSYLVLGIGFAFKAMAIYLLPVFAFWWIYRILTKRIKVAEFFAPVLFPVGYILTCIPSFLLGANFREAIITPIAGRSRALYGSNFYSFMSNRTEHENGIQLNFRGASTSQFIRHQMGGEPLPSYYDHYYSSVSQMVGIVLLIVVFVVFTLLLLNLKQTESLMQNIMLFTIAIIPLCSFFMPAQHETYFDLCIPFALIAYMIYRSREIFWALIALIVIDISAYTVHSSFAPIITMRNAGFYYVVIALFLMHKIYMNTKFHKGKSVAIS